MVIKACIFDLDGVIVDTTRYHFLCWQRLSKELGIHFTAEDNERLKGVSRMRSLDIVLEIGGISLDEITKAALAKKKNDWFVDYVNSMKPEEIFSGVKELLVKLRKRGLKVGLASSSKNAKTVIKRIKIGNEFDAIVDGTMITNSKPDPEIFLLTASLLHTSPYECVVFEDAKAGVEAARNAGMRSVGVGSARQLGKANLVISRTGDFNVELLESL